MLLTQEDKEVFIQEHHWPLAIDLFNKWGYDTSDAATLEVKNIDDITSELSAWGIPWKRIKWSYE